MLLYINNSILDYNENCNYLVNDYYKYIVDIIKNILKNNNLNIVVIFYDDEKYNFTPLNKNDSLKKKIIIEFNYEHTLVKIGGRDSDNFPQGNINSNDKNNNYLVRIHRYTNIKKADIIIDYSIPNIHNIKESTLFEEISEKMIYISPSIYDTYFIKDNRNNITLTTFVNTTQPRRANLLKKIGIKKIQHINVSNCFNKENLQTIYKNTKILINIHQTDHHHTFEELRVLPALQCGVIVICENSPLNELVPYNDYIIWESYENILDKVNEVLNNYDFFHNFIFNETKLKKLNELNYDNYNRLENKICQK